MVNRRRLALANGADDQTAAGTTDLDATLGAGNGSRRKAWGAKKILGLGWQFKDGSPTGYGGHISVYRRVKPRDIFFDDRIPLPANAG